METFTTPENKIEKTEKAQVLEMLRTYGFEHDETKALVMKWIDEQEAIVVKEDTPRTRILFEIERADLYLAVGDIDGALGCLEDARIQAHQENEEELYERIMDRMDEIEGV